MGRSNFLFLLFSELNEVARLRNSSSIRTISKRTGQSIHFTPGVFMTGGGWGQGEGNGITKP